MNYLTNQFDKTTASLAFAVALVRMMEINFKRKMLLMKRLTKNEIFEIPMVHLDPPSMYAIPAVTSVSNYLYLPIAITLSNRTTIG